MLVTIIDDSIPFDGETPAKLPLGGAEKGVVELAAALAARGHTVRVFNRCEMPAVVDDVSWQPIDTCKAAHTDWLIVHRKPSLFDRLPNADRKALWLAGPLDYLIKPSVFVHLNRHKPMLVLQSFAHSGSVPPMLNSFSASVIGPGVGEVYRTAPEMAPATPARAVVTTHPASGLDWLLDVWTGKVNPRLPWAELHVYSAILERGMQGAEVPERIKPVIDQLEVAVSRGVRVMRPLPDPEMAEVYRTARAHLYPGSTNDVLSTTLLESQAVGLPAVARSLGAATERIVNGNTGHLTGGADVFGGAVVKLLDEDETFTRMSNHARDLQRTRTWDMAARDFEVALK